MIDATFLPTLLLPILGVAVAHDLAEHRIPNVVVLVGLATALAASCAAFGMPGVGRALAGAAVGLTCFLPLYAFRGMAAGDVKLMACVGAFLGPSHALVAVAATLMTGAILAIGYVGFRYVATHRDSFPGGAAGERLWFPYAAAIAAGALVAIARV